MSISREQSYEQLPLEFIRQIDAVARAAERTWRSGTNVKAEELLLRVPTACRATLLEELLLLEAEHRFGRGTLPSAAEWLTRFPNDRSVVERVLNECGAAVDNPVSHNRFPEILGYTIERQLGRGATGVVYLARQERLQRMVAVKVVAAGIDLSKASAITRSEAEVIARLRHPNIVQVFEIGEAHGEPYLTLEYVTGGSLREWLLKKQAPHRLSAELIEQLSRAIHHAHTHGVVHRDLKPANILLMQADPAIESIDSHYESLRQPKISDFGLAKVLDALQIQTHSGTILGTPKYMAPEQAEGRSRDIGPATDVYALGAILFEMLTGRPPFESTSTLHLLKLISQSDAQFSAESVKHVTPDLQAICLKCLEKSPTRRYESALELADDLRRYLDDFPVTARRPTRSDMVAKFVRRNRGLVASIVAIFMTLVAASIGISIFAFREATARRHAEQLAQNEWIARASIASLRKQDLHNVYWANVHLAEQAWKGARLDKMQQHLQQAMPSQPNDEDLRGFEWHYLWRLCHPSTLVLRDHYGGSKVAFSPNGQWLASASSGNGIRIFDATNGALQFRLPGQSQVMDVAFSPDGRLLAVACRDGNVHVWSLESKTVVHLLKGHEHAVRSVVFSRDSQCLVTGDEIDKVILWSLNTQTALWIVSRPNLYAMDLAFSHDGKRIAIGSGSGVVNIIDAGNGQDMQTIKAHTTWLTGVAFSPDDQRLVSCGGDRTAKIWNLANIDTPVAVVTHDDWITAATFSADGQSIGTASRDGTIKLWDASTGQHQTTLMGHTNWVMSVTFSADGKHVASASIDGTARIWKPRIDWESRTIAKHSAAISCLEYSPDGELLFLGCADGKIISKNVSTGEEVGRFVAHQDCISDLAITPDGKKLISASQDDSIKIWDVSSGRELALLAGHTSDVRGLAIHPSGKQLVSGSNDQSLRVWDTESGLELKRLELGLPQVTLAFSTDGRLLASSGTAQVEIWDTTSWQKHQTLSGHSHVVASVAFSGDGKLLASGGTDRTICLWDLNSGQLLQRINGHTNIVTGLTFSRDSRRLFSCSHDSTIRFWETSSGRELLTLKNHSDWINCLSLSPSEDAIATASNDHTTQLIELSTTGDFGN